MTTSLMSNADSIVSRAEQFVNSAAPRDEVLRGAVSLLKQECKHYDWVGIYLLEGDTLVLHNYIGKHTDHTRIPVGSGVCGAAVAQRCNLVVGDVSKLENYLACSVETQSEIVVLIRRGDEIFGQLDIDSDHVNAFSDEDESLLERVADLLARRF
ncbi:MAG TPA: GAF domain-containing protein [Blastocatellia bacterium]|nr:GAF domain-containing protein [Blastocatellia bacterium]